MIIIASFLSLRGHDVVVPLPLATIRRPGPRFCFTCQSVNESANRSSQRLEPPVAEAANLFLCAGEKSFTDFPQRTTGLSFILITDGINRVCDRRKYDWHRPDTAAAQSCFPRAV